MVVRSIIVGLTLSCFSELCVSLVNCDMNSVSRRRENISEHLGAASVDNFEVIDLGTLAFGDEVSTESNVLGALPEAGLFRKCDSCFAVFVDDRWGMLVKAHFEAEFAEKEAFLCG